MKESLATDAVLLEIEVSFLLIEGDFLKGVVREKGREVSLKVE